MNKLDKLKIQIYADGADFESINKYNQDSIIKGFTANPSLMKSVGVNDCVEFAKKILSIVKNKPVSFEVFSDDLIEKFKDIGKDLDQFSIDTIKQLLKDSSSLNLKK
tara:strand:+ start:988 stop:1308 length:321 start_codon:yes stop_codon:yes gene_type:complete